MTASTRALIVEDIDTWVSVFSRAARRAGASEVVVCENLHMVKDALLSARFDVAILDVGLDPDDDLNADGIKALEAIREADGDSTRCILVTGWQGGDRLSLQARAQNDYGVDWAFMKEKYEAHDVIAKLSELLEQAPARRLSVATPMANLSSGMEPFRFEGQLIEGIEPSGGVMTIYSLVSRLIRSAIPLVALNPRRPMQQGADGVYVGMYWSRALAAAVAVGLSATTAWRENDDSAVPAELARQLPPGAIPDLVESVRERNAYGWLWELQGVDRAEFPK
jgi:CheY-like chemotaxis protein